MRGSRGYPKGSPYSTVPEGLLLRPAIPTDEIFQSEGTYGPKANFKISVRELPDYGRFRVTVTAARYDDGLLLDPGEPARDPDAPAAIVIRNPGRQQTVTIDQGGLFQVDLYEAERPRPPRPAAPSLLTEGLAGPWPADGGGPGRLEGDARYVDSPFGKALSLDGEGDSAVISRSEAMDVGEGDFTVAAWLHPRQLRRTGIVALGARQWTHGWYLETIGGQGAFRIETTRPDKVSNGGVTSPKGVIRKDAWQHVAAVVKRGEEQTRLYVNGYLVASGTVGPENLDNPGMDLHLGRLPGGNHFHGELDEVRLYRRALDESELQALVEPGRELAEPPPEEPQEVTLKLGEREYSAKLGQPAFLVVRLDAGSLNVETTHTGVKGISRVVMTPLSDDLELSRRFVAFEKRFPRLGVHLGLRRDCGSTFAPVGAPQTVRGGELARYVFEGAIRDYPSPDVEKDNVNYLAGIREIAVRSEYTDGRDLPRLLVRSVEFEGPLYENWPPRPASEHLHRLGPQGRLCGLRAGDRERFRYEGLPPSRHGLRKSDSHGGVQAIARRRTRFPREHRGLVAGCADIAAIPVSGREEHHAGTGADLKTSSWPRSSPIFCGTALRTARRWSLPPAASSAAGWMARWRG